MQELLQELNPFGRRNEDQSFYAHTIYSKLLLQLVKNFLVKILPASNTFGKDHVFSSCLLEAKFRKFTFVYLRVHFDGWHASLHVKTANCMKKLANCMFNGILEDSQISWSIFHFISLQI